MIDRELALYRRFQEHGAEVGIVSYGGPSDLSYTDRLPGLKIMCNQRRLPASWYERLIPWLHGAWLRKCHVLKTNQINGGRPALRAARLWGKPLMARCGYLLSDFLAGGDGAEAALAMEISLFTAARRVVVTTRAMADDVARLLPQAASKTTVIPNYVDTDLFRPDGNIKKDIDVLFIGRLAEQKNIEELLKAATPLTATVTIVGDGPLRGMVERARTDLGDRLHWVQRMEGKDIPGLMARAKVFILPSRWEGHPKTLIEAMACGLAVIGGDSPGIREVIDHGVTGRLSGIDHQSLRGAITFLLGNPELCRVLGSNARARVVADYSLDMIAEKEWTLLQELCG